MHPTTLLFFSVLVTFALSAPTPSGKIQAPKSGAGPNYKRYWGEEVFLEQSTGKGVAAFWYDVGVYLYGESSPGKWEQTAFIENPEPGSYSDFGREMAWEGDTLMIGAGGDEMVYVYQRNSGGSWDQVQVIECPEPRMSGQFGAHLALEGDELIVSAPNGRTEEGEFLDGRVFFYQHNGSGEWSLIQKLVIPPETETSETRIYGRDLARRGRILAVGALGDDRTKDDDDGGAIHIWRRTNDGWAYVTRVEKPDATGKSFGLSVALNEKYLVAGKGGGAHFFSTVTWEEETLMTTAGRDFSDIVAGKDFVAVLDPYQRTSRKEEGRVTIVDTNKRNWNDPVYIEGDLSEQHLGKSGDALVYGDRFIVSQVATYGAAMISIYDDLSE